MRCASSRKIFVFMLSIGTMVIIIGSFMFVVEGPGHGVTSIPRSMYWAVVTLTTVGYGDIAPQTPLGPALASVVMILGYERRDVALLPLKIVEGTMLPLDSKSEFQVILKLRKRASHAARAWRQCTRHDETNRWM